MKVPSSTPASPLNPVCEIARNKIMAEDDYAPCSSLLALPPASEFEEPETGAFA